jgi:hypothetical protein
VFGEGPSSKVSAASLRAPTSTRETTLIGGTLQIPGVIVSLHVATGAAAGAALGSRRSAVLAGLVLHALGDRMPHRDIGSRRFELWSGAVLVALVAGVRGLRDGSVVGAIASSAPDLEHVLPFPRPGGRKLFPSHRIRGWHRSGGVSTAAQLVAAGTLVGLVLGGLGRRR